MTSISISVAPHEGCDVQLDKLSGVACISILAPHEGCDEFGDCSLWGFPISILAPHEGCDFSVQFTGPLLSNFNPRTP